MRIPEAAKAILRQGGKKLTKLAYEFRVMQIVWSSATWRPTRAVVVPMSRRFSKAIEDPDFPYEYEVLLWYVSRSSAP